MSRVTSRRGDSLLRRVVSPIIEHIEGASSKLRIAAGNAVFIRVPLHQAEAFSIRETGGIVLADLLIMKP